MERLINQKLVEFFFLKNWQIIFESVSVRKQAVSVGNQCSLCKLFGQEKLQEEKGKISPHLEVVCATIIHLLLYRLATLVSTVFENHRKSLLQHCERSELRLHLSGQKLIENVKNGPFWRVFENLKLAVTQCYQTGQF